MSIYSLLNILFFVLVATLKWTLSVVSGTRKLGSNGLVNVVQLVARLLLSFEK